MQEAEIMEAWTKAAKVDAGDRNDNVDEERTNAEDEMFELERGVAQTMEDPVQQFVIPHGGARFIWYGKEKVDHLQ